MKHTGDTESRASCCSWLFSLNPSFFHVHLLTQMSQSRLKPTTGAEQEIVPKALVHASSLGLGVDPGEVAKGSKARPRC